MQELIDYLLKWSKEGDENFDALLCGTLVKATLALEKEKEQKLDFAKKCLDKALDLDIRTSYGMVEEYYNQTYNSNQATFGYVSPQTQSNNQNK